MILMSIFLSWAWSVWVKFFLSEFDFTLIFCCLNHGCPLIDCPDPIWYYMKIVHLRVKIFFSLFSMQKFVYDKERNSISGTTIHTWFQIESKNNFSVFITWSCSLPYRYYSISWIKIPHEWFFVRYLNYI